MTKGGPKKRATAAAKARWAGTTEAERTEAMRQMGRTRWEAMTRFERSLFMQ